MSKDLFNNTIVRRVISSTRVADNTAQVGQIIDHANTNSAMYIVNIGTIADADTTFTLLLEEGNDSGLSDAAAVADADLLGTEAGAAFQFDDDNEVRTLGYTGNKRYTRLTITPANNTGNADLGATVVLGGVRKAPKSSQVGAD